MIKNLDIVAQKMKLDDDIKRYVIKKIGRLSHYMPRHARKSVRSEVKLREANKARGNKYECEVIMYLPSETLTAKDSTLNIFAAIDIVEAKMKTQLRKYKETHTDHKSKFRQMLKRDASQPI